MRKVVGFLGQTLMLFGICAALLGTDERSMGFEIFFGAIVAIITGFGMYGWANEKK